MRLQMQSQIRLSTKITTKGKQRQIDGKSIQSIQLQNYIKIKYELVELNNFHDFLIGRKDLIIGYKSGHSFTTSTIETSKSIKKNIEEFNFYMRAR